MKLGKKIVAAVFAVATALTALTVSAFAVDPVGTNPTTLKEGEKYTGQIVYNDSNNYDDGHNYQDFIFTAPADGTMKVTYDAAINFSVVNFYEEDTKQAVDVGKIQVIMKTGKIDGENITWDANAGTSACEINVGVTKGKYIIRVRRTIYFHPHVSAWNLFGSEGNGRFHITAEMVKPDAPQDIKVAEKTDTSVKLQWREPEGIASYDLRYKASGDSKWTTITDIMDNNYTLKKLKGATKYTYQMRSHAIGGLVSDWSKAASVKTNDPKNVKFAVPTVNTSVAVHITWGEVKNATGYKFQYSTDQKNWKTITVTDPEVDMPVTSGKTYYYKVAAKNSAKTGSFSKVYSIKIG